MSQVQLQVPSSQYYNPAVGCGKLGYSTMTDDKTFLSRFKPFYSFPRLTFFGGFLILPRRLCIYVATNRGTEEENAVAHSWRVHYRRATMN